MVIAPPEHCLTKQVAFSCRTRWWFIAVIPDFNWSQLMKNRDKHKRSQIHNVIWLYIHYIYDMYLFAFRNHNDYSRFVSSCLPTTGSTAVRSQEEPLCLATLESDNQSGAPFATVAWAWAGWLVESDLVIGWWPGGTVGEWSSYDSCGILMAHDGRFWRSIAFEWLW